MAKVARKKAKGTKKETGPVAWLTYLAVRCILTLMQAFPLHWNLQTARLLARIWAFIMPRHRNRAIEHLRAAYPGQLATPDLERLADRCLESVTMFAVETMCLPRLVNAFTWSQYIQLRDFEPFLQRALRGEGMILVTGHYGPFELIGHLLACLGFRIHAVMRPLDNAYLNRYLVETRRTHGLNLLDKKGATAEAEEILRGGGLLAFIGDQDAGRKGIFVDFFGRPASTYKSIGLLAMTVNCPIVVGYTRRLGTLARYEIAVQRIIDPGEWAGRDDPLQWITQTYTSAIEEAVRQHPEQYLWIHRRWKSEPRRAIAPANSPGADTNSAGRMTV